jgi:glycine/D-amino acid oxidase-like deaminating enzyme
MNRHHILILGGGFAGLCTAMELITVRKLNGEEKGAHARI